MFLAGHSAAQEELTKEQKEELKKFRGAWQATAFIIGATPVGEDQLKNTTIIIDGSKFTLKTGKNEVEGTYTIDPTKSPKTIDAVLVSPDGKKSELAGIYTWEDGKRKSCFALPGNARPDQFRQQQGYVTMEWEKKK
jgi:uncharacterized protein (TIGR03067 family)